VAADRAVTVKLKAEVADFQRNMKDAAKSTEAIGTQADKTSKTSTSAFGKMIDSADKNSAAWNTAGTAFMAVGAAAAVGVGMAVAKFADFDAAMSSAQAATMTTGATLDDLRASAIKAGADTQYSATEAAQAITEMGKAGVSSADIIGGGLTGALSLAAAGQLEVGRAGEIAATAMNQFGLAGKDLPHVADLLAAGAGKAMGSVDDLANALKFVGPVAKNLDVSIEQTTGVLAEFASQGIIGEQAGTSMRGMLLSLTSPSKIAAKEMETLGLNMYDASGKFIGLEAVAGQLQDRMGTLSDADRNASMGRMFGNEQITAATILYAGGSQAVADWTEKVNDSGFAAEQAAALTNNLKGDMERLGGSLDTALIQTGSSANSALRDMVQNLTSVVNAFGSAPEGVQGATLAIGGATTAIGLLGGGFMLAAPKIVETHKALKTLGISATGAKVAMSGVGAILAVGIIGLTTWATAQGEAEQKVSALADALDQQNGALGKNSAEWIKSELTKDQSFGINNTKSMVEAADELGVSVETLTKAYEGQPDAMKSAKDAAEAWYVANAKGGDMFLSKANLVERFTKNIDDQSGRLKDAKNVVEEKNKVDAEATGTTDALTEAVARATANTEAQAVATEEATKAQEEWAKMVSESDASFVNLGSSWDAVIQKNTDVAQSTADSTESSKDSWEDYYDGVTVSSGEYIAELQRQVDAQAAWEENILAISERVKTGMTGDMAEAATTMIDELIDLGPEGAAQVQLLKDMSAEEFAKVVELWSQKGTEAVTEFTNKVESYRQPVIGILADATAAQAAYDGLGRPINTLMTITVSGYEAARAKYDGLGRPIEATPVKHSATGGLITGPGTGTSDSIPAMLSNREYVVKASSVQKYGTAFFDSVNAQRFASGGQVGAASPGAGSSAPMIGSLTVVGYDPSDAVKQFGHELNWLVK